MELILGTIMGAIFASALTFAVGVGDIREIKKQAIERGYATMAVTDTIRGTTEFRWKE